MALYLSRMTVLSSIISYRAVISESIRDGDDLKPAVYQSDLMIFSGSAIKTGWFSQTSFTKSLSYCTHYEIQREHSTRRCLVKRDLAFEMPLPSIGTGLKE